MTEEKIRKIIIKADPLLLEQIAKKLVCSVRGRNYQFSQFPINLFIDKIDEDTEIDENYGNSIISPVEDGFVYETISGRTIDFQEDRIEIDFLDEGSFNFASFCLEAIRDASWSTKRSSTEDGSLYKYNCPYCNKKGQQKGDYGWSFIQEKHDCYEIKMSNV